MCKTGFKGSEFGWMLLKLMKFEPLNMSGSWRITRFMEHGDDEANYFSDCSFTFGSNGTLTAGVLSFLILV